MQGEIFEAEVIGVKTLGLQTQTWERDQPTKGVQTQLEIHHIFAWATEARRVSPTLPPPKAPVLSSCYWVARLSDYMYPEQVAKYHEFTTDMDSVSTQTAMTKGNKSFPLTW